METHLYRRTVLAAIAAVIGAFSADAASITYTTNISAAGCLGALIEAGCVGGISFNGPVTVTLSGDTNGIIPGPLPGSYENPGTATFTVPGRATATFTDPMTIDSTGSSTLQGQYAVLIGSPNISAVSAILGLQGYDLSSNLTYYGLGGLGNGGGNGNIFDTTLGPLEFVRLQPPPSAPSVFTAVLTQSASTQGGTTSAPVTVSATGPLGSISGTIAGLGSQDYYWFYWGGGIFSASASISQASSLATYAFSAGVAGSCNSIGTATLNSGDSFSAGLSANLAPGKYCIGLTATSAYDPAFTLTFNTPVNAAPEPNTAATLSAGLAVAAAVGRKLRKRR
jgi:hypothetical protein